jgi:ADP-ribosylglycohydrolase
MTDHAAIDPQLATRARGTLLGLVAGNQLGVATETLGTPEAIRAAFPQGIWDLPAPPKGSPYDDDAALTLLLAESLIDRGDFDAADVGARWVKWMKVDGRGLGVTTRNALRLIERGVEPFEAGRQAKLLTPKSAGNGSVMRCAPVSIRFHDNIEKLLRVSTQQAAITHSDERCLWGAAAVNLALRELLYGNSYFLDEVVHRLKDRAPRELLEAIHRVPREEQTDLPIAVAGAAGYVVHCVEIAFWFAVHDRALEDALVFLAQAGGDTDTNAAVTGALLGAKYGATALPQRWMAQMVGVDGILGLADRLLDPGASRRSQAATAARRNG